MGLAHTVPLLNMIAPASKAARKDSCMGAGSSSSDTDAANGKAFVRAKRLDQAAGGSVGGEVLCDTKTDVPKGKPWTPVPGIIAIT